MKVKLICKECGRKFVLTEDNLFEKQMPDGVTATYCRCLRCFKRYIVQLDNEETKDLVKQAERTAMDVFSEQQSARMKDLKRKVDKQRALIGKKIGIEVDVLTMTID